MFDLAAGTRTCSTCGETSPAMSEWFHKRGKSLDGCQGRCKACTKAYDEQWYAANRERAAETGHAWKAANRERTAEYQREWVSSNRERARERCREWYAANLGSEHARAIAKDHRRRAAEGSFTKEEVVALLEAQKHKCEYCGAELLETSYHLDHIVPVSKGGTSYIENIAAACPCCNLSKSAKDLDVWLNERAVA